MKGIIYKCTCTETGKHYIGQTVQEFKNRKRDHIKSALNPKDLGYDYHFHRAIRKYGEDKFVWDIIETIESSDLKNLGETLDILETSYIEKYDSYKNGYNSTPGGNSYTKCPKRVKVYEENGSLIEILESYREVMKKYNISYSTVRNVCWKKNQKFAYINGKRYIFRYEDDDYTEEEISEVKSIKYNQQVLMFNLDLECVSVFNSPKDAGDKLGLQNSRISTCCNRRSNFVQWEGKRYIFRYSNDSIITEEELQKVLNIKSDPKIAVIAKDLVTGEIIGEFKTISEGARFIGISSSSKIGLVCKGERNSAGKYNGHPVTWKYKEK